MNKLFTFFLVLLTTATFAQDSLNMTKLSVWTTTKAIEYNDCWGYTDPQGNEYAIVGSNWGIHFVNVTDPENPVEVNSFIGQNDNVTWRDFKVFGTTAYAVADQYSFENAALSIFDLSDLPNSVTIVKQDDSYSQACHNIFIEGNLMYMCSNQDQNGERWSLEVFTLEADPTDPVLLISMDDSYFGGGGDLVHDVYVRNDTAYLSCGYAGLFIYDFTNPVNPQFVNAITSYTAQGYNHSSWLHPDRHTLVVADEVPNGLPMKAFDASDIMNISSAADTFSSNVGARPHNPFFVYNDMVISYYLDGLQIFDFSDPANPVQTAYYDTYPDNDTLSNPYPNVFYGTWGTYPFFESRNIAAVDITYGLFMLTKINDVYTDKQVIDVCDDNTQSATIDFTAKGTYNGANTFYLEMADASGSFVNAQRIDSVTGTAGNYSFTFDPTTQSGARFRFRISSTDPVVSQSSWVDVRYLQTPATPVIENNAGVLFTTTTAMSYQWFRDGVAILGADRSEYTPIAPGDYTVQVSNGTCAAMSPVMPLAVGVELSAAMRVNVFPNPSNGQVNLYNPDVKNLNVEVYGASGQVVRSFNTTAKSTLLELESGVYMIRVSDKQQVWNQKLVVY